MRKWSLLVVTLVTRKRKLKNTKLEKTTLSSETDAAEETLRTTEPFVSAWKTLPEADWCLMLYPLTLSRTVSEKPQHGGGGGNPHTSSPSIRQKTAERTLKLHLLDSPLLKLDFSLPPGFTLQSRISEDVLVDDSFVQRNVHRVSEEQTGEKHHTSGAFFNTSQHLRSAPQRRTRRDERRGRARQLLQEPPFTCLLAVI